jgi:hypothetical protein
MAWTSDLRWAARFARDLPGFLRHPVTLPEARAIVARRRAGRAADFLALIRAGVYAQPRSPYRALLRHAGCEPGDLAALVAREGVEGALRVLCARGVYLSVEEFKGRQPLSRGGVALPCEPADLGNPLAAAHFRGATSGSRGRPAPVPLGLGYIRDWSVNFCLLFDCLGPRRWRTARWSLPGGEGMAFSLLYAGFGAPPERWFSTVDPAGAGVDPRYRWAARLLGGVSRAAGVPMPAPEHVPVDAPGRILDWLDTVRARGDAPHLVSYVSPAASLARAALDTGRDLGGVLVRLVGEPVTAGRLAAICRAGADARADYGTVDAGVVGSECHHRVEPDEVHLWDDLLAVIQPDPPAPAAGLPADTLLFTSLRATAPLLLLNVSLGDRGVLGPRACGCPLEAGGWTRHLHTIRSFEKLTAGGMTFLDVDVVRVLEDVLPARFGGDATDYQLVEHAGGSTARLALRVHPRVGPLDPALVTAVFLAALGAGSPTARLMQAAWGEAGLVAVERRPPATTGAGKILHVHTDG